MTIVAEGTARRSTHRHPISALGWALAMTFADGAVWRRIASMAVGIGVCTLALLALVSITPTVDRLAVGSAALQPTVGSTEKTTFSYHYVSFPVDDETVTGALLSGSDQSPPPPGAPTFPRTGELYVSPALADLLGSPGGSSARAVLPGRIIGILPVDRLRGADDLFFYSGSDRTLAADPASGWGRGASNRGLDTELWVLLSTGSVVLLIPLMLFIGLCSRLGSARRERRNGVLVLLGAGGGRIRLLGAVESGAAGLLGVGLGLGALVVLRQFADQVRFAGVGIRAEDIGPTAAGGWWVSIAVVALATLTGSFVGHRPADAARPQGSIPLRSRPFRWWWRVLLLIVTAATAGWVIQQSGSADWTFAPEPLRVLLPCVLALLVMFSLVAVAAPLIQLVCRLWHPSSNAGQLARGRILADGTLTTRSAAALATVLAGAIALMPLLGNDPRAGDVSIQTYGQTRGTVDQIAGLESAARRSPGLLSIQIDGTIGVEDTAGRQGPSLNVINCSAVEQADPTAGCRDGDIFRIPRADPLNDPLTLPPYPIMLGQYGSSGEQLPGALWSPPPGTKTLSIPEDPNGNKAIGSAGLFADFLLTPAAVTREFPGLSASPVHLSVSMQLRPGTLPQTQLALSPLGDRAFGLLAFTSEDQNVTPFRPWIIGSLIGVAALTLLICALAQVLTTAEQIRERRRPYALGRAAGVPVLLLSLSIGMSLVVPIVVMSVAAVGAGVLLTLMLQRILQLPGAAIAWPVVGIGVGAAVLAAVLVAIGASLSLQRSTRPAAMRTE